MRIGSKSVFVDGQTRKKKQAASLQAHFSEPATPYLLSIAKKCLDPGFDELSQEHGCFTPNQTSLRVVGGILPLHQKRAQTPLDFCVGDTPQGLKIGAYTVT